MKRTPKSPEKRVQQKPVAPTKTRRAEKPSKAQPAIALPEESALGGQSPTLADQAKIEEPALGAQDLYFFNEGTHFHLHEKLGAHLRTIGDVSGAFFAVWAPDAQRVSVIGDFNRWNPDSHPLFPQGQSGIWQGFVPQVRSGERYKYRVVSRYNDYRVDKADPFAFFSEMPPRTASIVWDLTYNWDDREWMSTRRQRNALDAPQTIYEIHLGSWRRIPEEARRSLTYRELAEQLPAYARQMGFTHVELLPVMEHPFYGSWGYEVTGYFAPTSRYGTPQDFMYLVDCLHQEGIGVILDWVPAHFPNDAHGLGYFDGTHLFEHADPRQGVHPDWHSLIFNYGRREVQNFLISNVLFWLETYHIDGLRLDAVASMLYLDYSRKEGEWIPNAQGGRENMDAVAFLRRFNEAVDTRFPDVETVAEESTSWPLVSRPPEVGGLGFRMKWDMGWMHDTLDYLARNPVHRKYHHSTLTFRMVYAFSENFVLPLSHDEVVHGKGSLLRKMPGDEWQQFANLRLLFGYMYGQPGKKLLFMGGEFAQWAEWSHESSLEWHLLEFPRHAGVQRWVADLNRFYCHEPGLYEQDCDANGFAWVDCNDADHSVLSFLRKGSSTQDVILVVCNFTPVPRHQYPIGVPYGGVWHELLNSDSEDYGGSGVGNLGSVEASALSTHGLPHTVSLTLPPLAVLFLKRMEN